MVTGSPNELAMGSPSKNFEAHQQIKIISIHNGSYVIWDYLEQFRSVPHSSLAKNRLTFQVHSTSTINTRATHNREIPVCAYLSISTNCTRATQVLGKMIMVHFLILELTI